MTIGLFDAGFALAMFFVGVMGFAIQRGATCTVAAVDEILHKRRAHRLRSLLEAALWVTGGILIARALRLSAIMPGGFAIDGTTVAGAVLLGFGAWVNRACVFGAVARFGSGEWSYILTPVGFFAGALIFHGTTKVAHPLADSSPVLAWSNVVAIVFGVFVAARIVLALRTRPRAQPLQAWLRESVWAPGAATVIIGITFVLVLFLAGATWAYTDALSELAMGVNMNTLPRLLLFFALLVGSVIGGVTAQRFAPTPVSLGAAIRCFSGGVLMGLGSLLIPGSNDGLILIGMPLLWPHAWLAFLIMCLTVAAAMLVSARLSATSHS